jgi:hypothetical protein
MTGDHQCHHGGHDDLANALGNSDGTETPPMAYRDALPALRKKKAAWFSSPPRPHGGGLGDDIGSYYPLLAACAGSPLLNIAFSSRKVMQPAIHRHHLLLPRWASKIISHAPELQPLLGVHLLIFGSRVPVGFQGAMGIAYSTSNNPSSRPFRARAAEGHHVCGLIGSFISRWSMEDKAANGPL